MKLEFPFYQLFLLVVYFKYVKLVPDAYCLPPLNRSDCGIPPTPVFSYYKYGSRCEIDFWRGCPTENMFENEYHCSHYCIGRTKFYGRQRGSWNGRDRTSIDDLTLSELQELNGILHNIDDSVTDAALERLVNRSPLPRPRVVSTETMVEDVTEENEDNEDDEDYVTIDPVTATQMPLTGEPNQKHVFLRDV